MSENTSPNAWPPTRKRAREVPETSALAHSLSLDSDTHIPTIPSTPRNTQSETWFPLASTKQATQYRNGFETTPKAISFEPYANGRTARKRRRLFDWEPSMALMAQPPLSVTQWNTLAKEVALVSPEHDLHPFQMQCGNLVVERTEDLAIIAPTGSGKSVCFSLALHAQKRGISVVITPYTTLGKEGANKYIPLFLDSAVYTYLH